MKKLAVIAVASLGLLAGEVAAQGWGNRQGGGPGAQQADPNNPNPPPRRPRGDQAPTTQPMPAPQPQRAPRQPPVVQPAPQPVPPLRPSWGGGGRPPVVVQQPQRDPSWRDRGGPNRGGPGWGGGGRPYYDGPVYRPAPPVVVVPGPSYGPPPQWRHRRSYDWCRAKAERLHHFEWLMQQDGRVSKDEARIARNLRADLNNSCGGGRWAPNRGWYYG